MQTMTIKINDDKNFDFLVELLSKFSFVKEIKAEGSSVSNIGNSQISISKPSGTPSIEDFAGMWEKSPKTIEQIRTTGWQRT